MEEVSMRFAILTDIHANREAYEAVLADAAARGVDRIVLLGDLVGYGPDPAWCVEKTAELEQAGAVCIQGNHDSAAAGEPESLSTHARQAMDWTKTRLTDVHRTYLASLPLTLAIDDVLFTHASANDPGDWIYVTSASEARGSFRSCVARIIVCGHVHVPMLASSDLRGVVRLQTFLMATPIPLIRSRRWLAVVGAVGQPRDGIAQAGYAMLDTGTNELTFRRVPYDVAKTVQKMRATGLPENLALRLIRGK
jgi:diadenosine tetraphosphatase ApaH/serine/threonine PP2A family protein phosphatase